MNSITIKARSLGFVVMPLVRVMADASLSWHERERVSMSIQACLEQWAAMEKERETLNQQGSVMQGYGSQDPQRAAGNLNSAALQRGEIG